MTVKKLIYKLQEYDRDLDVEGYFSGGQGCINTVGIGSTYCFNKQKVVPVVIITEETSMKDYKK